MKLFYQLGYKYFRVPWDMGPREELVQLVDGKRITPCRAIDLGCGRMLRDSFWEVWS